MVVLLAFAFVSGIITILSPCILPVLPIVLSGGVGGGKARPFGVVAAFVVTFTVFTLTLSAVVQLLGIPPDTLRVVAVVLLVIFGFVMVVPWLRDRFELLASRLTSGSRSNAPGGKRSGGWAGFWSGIPVGFSLGVVWTPCVGPIMASVISLALTQRVDGGSVLITLAYSLGTAIPMLLVMFGGRALLNRVPGLSRNMANIQKAFGVLMILVGVGIGFGWDRQVQTALLRAFPAYGSGLTAIEQNSLVKRALDARAPERAQDSGSMVFSGAGDLDPKDGVLGDYGEAPPFVAAGPWYNTSGLAEASSSGGSTGSAPLTLADLRGKVVLVDFWTYSCVNCVRTLPYLKAWYKAYKDEGLVIVGVHTPEFEFERVPKNVKTAIKTLGIDWPVVQDNTYDEWNAYGNRFWPAHYFIDAKGRVRYFHFGEGSYDVSERVIQSLLREAGANPSGIVSKPDVVNYARTPETYLGYTRGRGFVSATSPVPDEPADYAPAHPPENGEWSLAGRWTITGEYVAPASAGTLRLGFDAKNVFLVVQPGRTDGTITVLVDGKQAGETADVKDGVVTPTESRLYQLVDLPKPGAHQLELEVTGGLRLFAFTFG